MARAAIVAGARAGALGLLPRSSITVRGGDRGCAFDRHLARRLGVSEVHLTLPVGPPRANRKPIVQVSDTNGDPIAYAKIGHNELTRTLVRAEGRALRTIAAAEPSGIVVPEVRGQFDWHGNDVLIVSPLTIPSNQPSDPSAHARIKEVAMEIARLAGPLRTVPWDAHPLRSRLHASLRSMGDRAVGFAAAVERLYGGTELETGGWHGDFNAGNFAIARGRCPVWDWERYEVGVPVGFDILHHDLHRWITVDGVPPKPAAERLVSQAPRLLAGVVVPEACDLTVRAYLLTLAERYLRDDQEKAGAQLGAVTTWLLPVVERGQSTRSEDD